MYGRNRYFAAVAKKVSDCCGKPLTIIAAMAFLFVWTFAMPFIGLPMMGNLIATMAITFITLLLVLILQKHHKQDIHALQARLDALVAELKDNEQTRGLGRLSEAELQQLRILLKQQTADDERGRPSRRDNRPSLF